MSVGFRVYMNREMPDPEIVEGFRDICTANIADTMSRLSAMSAEIRRMSKPGLKMLGVALTVKARAGDNLMFHKALNMAGPGDIIVVSNGLDRNRSLMGEIMAIFARNKGISGIVLDGPIRDVDVLSNFEMPIYATGTTPGGPYKLGPGEINVPVSCGGISVNPGDIIVGDDDGVIVIPKEDAAKVLEDSKVLKRNDLKNVKAAENNEADRRWIDKLLKENNCEFIY